MSLVVLVACQPSSTGNNKQQNEAGCADLYSRISDSPERDAKSMYHERGTVIFRGYNEAGRGRYPGLEDGAGNVSDSAVLSEIKADRVIVEELPDSGCIQYRKDYIGYSGIFNKIMLNILKSL